MAFTIDDTIAAQSNNGPDPDQAEVTLTPPANSFIVAYALSEDSTFTVSGGGLTWTQQVIMSGASHVGAIWTSSNVGSSPGSMTINANNGQGGLGPGMTLKLYTVVGANPNGPVGATGAGTGTTDPFNPDLYTSTVDNSRAFYLVLDTNNNNAAVVTITSSDVETSLDRDFVYTAAGIYKSTDTTPVSTVVTGDVDTDGGVTPAWKWCAIEVLPPSVPDAPTISSQGGGHTRAGIEWTQGSSDGGSAITGHKIRHATAAAPTTWLGTTDTSSANRYGAVTGLTNGTAYVFQVLAYNAIGDGAWSATSGSATPVDNRGVRLLENVAPHENENGNPKELESGMP